MKTEAEINAERTKNFIACGAPLTDAEMKTPTSPLFNIIAWVGVLLAMAFVIGVLMGLGK